MLHSTLYIIRPMHQQCLKSNSFGGDAFTENAFYGHGVKVTQHVAQYPLHHMTYAPAKFEVARCKGFGGDAFTRKCTI